MIYESVAYELMAYEIEDLLDFSGPSLKINRHVAFGLALQSGIAQWRRPYVMGAIIFQAVILHRLMQTLADVMQHNPRFFVPGYRKTDPIGASRCRHTSAPAGIAHIAELAQLGF